MSSAHTPRSGRPGSGGPSAPVRKGTLHLVSVKGTPALILQGSAPADIEKITGATFVRGHGVWAFPAFRPVLQDVLEDLRKRAPWITLTPEAQAHADALRATRPLPEDFTYLTKPAAHQVEGLHWLYNHPRAGLFFDPGLGKSKIIVDYQRLIGGTFLIQCPRVMLHSWRREFLKHGGIEDVLVLEGNPRAKRALLEQAIAKPPAALVVTYETAAALTSDITAVPYTRIVLDEAHRIKAVSSVRTRASLILSEKAPVRVLLTGTPTLGNPFSLYPQLRFLGHYFAPENWIEFRKRFAVYPPHELKTGKLHQVLGYQNLDLLNERLSRVCVRKRQDDCLDLPGQQIIDQVFRASDEQRRAYNELVTCGGDALGQDIRDRVLMTQEYGVQTEHHVVGARGARTLSPLSHADGPVLDAPFVLATEPVTQLVKLEQILGGFVHKTRNNPNYCHGCEHVVACVDENVRPFTKRCPLVQTKTTEVSWYKDNARAAACADLLDSILEDPSHKVIVWVRFLAELSVVEGLCKAAGVASVTVQGGMPTEEFEGAMRRFEEDPACRVYIGQIASGIGVTLNAANYTIYYTLPWSHEHYVQSLARNYRIGQSRRVTVYRLIAEGSLDHDKAAILDQKIEIEALLTEEGNPDSCGEEVLKIITKLKPIFY